MIFDIPTPKQCLNKQDGWVSMQGEVYDYFKKHGRTDEETDIAMMIVKDVRAWIEYHTEWVDKYGHFATSPYIFRNISTEKMRKMQGILSSYFSEKGFLFRETNTTETSPITINGDNICIIYNDAATRDKIYVCHSEFTQLIKDGLTKREYRFAREYIDRKPYTLSGSITGVMYGCPSHYTSQLKEICEKENIKIYEKYGKLYTIPSYLRCREGPLFVQL